MITIPVGYAFYQPDPAYTAWAKEEKRLKKRGKPKALRPKKPEPNPAYPSKQQIALTLLEEFCRDCPYVTIKLVLADALYGTADFMDKAALITKQHQITCAEPVEASANCVAIRTYAISDGNAIWANISKQIGVCLKTSRYAEGKPSA